MEALTDLMKAWPIEWQIGFCCGTVLLPVVAVRAVLTALVHGMVTILRGYPPQTNISERKADDDSPKCDNSDNLNVHCLNQPQGCTTKEECAMRIALHNKEIVDELS